jgi:hypothetical protein
MTVNFELSVYGLLIKSRLMGWVCVAHMGEMRNVYEILIRKPEGKRPLRKPRHR